MLRSPFWIIATTSSFELGRKEGNIFSYRGGIQHGGRNNAGKISHHLNCFRNMFRFKFFFGSRKEIYRRKRKMEGIY